MSWFQERMSDLFSYVKARSSHTFSRNRIAIACGAFAEIWKSFPITFGEAPQFLKRTKNCTDRECFLSTVSFDLDLSRLTRTYHVADLQSSAGTILEVSVAKFCDFELIVSYSICIVFAHIASMNVLRIGEFQFFCPDEQLSHQPAVVEIFIPLSAEHNLSDNWVTN